MSDCKKKKCIEVECQCLSCGVPVPQWYNGIETIDNLLAPQQMVAQLQYAVVIEEGSTPMYVNNEADLAAKRIRRLKDRADGVYSEKRLELRKQFNIDDDQIKNALELIDAIKNGRYILDEEKAKKEWYGATHGISFRDPSKPADRPGYDLAKVKLGASLEDVKDVIIVSSPEAGLEALKTFKEWKLS